MDLASLLGTLLGLGAVFGGALLEGLHPGDILVGTAALIVLGGTLAATLLSFPGDDVRRAFAHLPLVYGKVELDVRPLIAEIVRVATVARKEGILAVEGQRESIQDPLFKRAVKFVIDGFDPGTVREIIDNEIMVAQEEDEAAAKVWEGAGGYAPTIGILGAVLGLIHVMKSLDDPSKIGSGIAVAFVATVYGVGSANLIFLPWGAKLKRKAAQRVLSKEVVKLGVIGIQEGLNPHFIQEKLEVFVQEHLRGVPLDDDEDGK
jgi:chemotaxis protein MotA